MSATSVDHRIGPPSRLARAISFYRASIGKKVVMAATGVVWFGYLVGHLAGNLQVFAGREKINAYAKFLHETPSLLWSTRILLVVSLVLHVVAAVQLTWQKRRARPVGYAKLGRVASSYASRTMMWSGPIIAAFILYHLLHLTTGTAHPSFEEGDVFANMVSGFRSLPVVVAYTVAMLMVGMHLYHGLYSMFQSIGFSHPRYTPTIKTAAGVVAAALTAGFLSIPFAVLLDLIRP